MKYLKYKMKQSAPRYRMYKFVGLVLFLSVIIYSCRDENKGIQAQEMPLTEAVYASGNIKALNQYIVYASSSGILKNRWVEENDLVKKGMLLAEIDNDKVDYQVINAQRLLEESKRNASENSEVMRQLKNDIVSAKAKMEADSVNATRYTLLYKSGGVTKLETEQKLLEYTVSKNNYASLLLRKQDLQKTLQTNVVTAGSNLNVNMSSVSDRMVKSYLDGKVYSFYKKPGELVIQQEPLAIIGDPTHFVIELQVDELDINRLRLGMKTLISFDTYGDTVFTAKISKIYPAMDIASRTFKVEAILDNPPAGILPGLTVEANIIVAEKDKTLVIPKEYLLEGDSVRTGKNEKIKVTTGLRNLKYVEILSGLHKEAKIYK